MFKSFEAVGLHAFASTLAKRRGIWLLGATLFLMAWGPATAQSQQLGYEFFSKKHGQVHHVYNLTGNQLETLAPTTNAPFQGNAKQLHRIIDLVIEKSGPKYSDWRFSAALMKNSGWYERDSWLFWNLTEDSVKELEQIKTWCALDIEHSWHLGAKGLYEKRYAIVLTENPQEYEWTVLLDATQAQVDAQVMKKRRPIDIDAFDEGLWPKVIPKASLLRYDAIFVENGGANKVQTVYGFMSESQIKAFWQSGYHVIDVQGVPLNQTYFLDPELQWHVIMVQTNNTWWTFFEKTMNLTVFEAMNPDLRMVDLKPYGDGAFRVTFIPQD